MATKPKKTEKPEIGKLSRKNPELKLLSDQTKEQHARAYADMLVSSELSALRVITGATGQSALWNDVDVPSLTEGLRDQAARVNRGDMSQAEAMLMNQATALQSLFARLAERGMGCVHAPTFEANMRIALRAQSQCRATLETLATIKNPPVVFAKQANISSGHQQVNNGIPTCTHAHAHAGKIINQQNELLEVQHGSETVDTRTAGATIGKNPAMATVG